MAVVHKYSPDREAGTITHAREARGSNLQVVTGRAEIAAADSDGSTFRLATVSGDLVPVKLELYTAAAFAGGVVQSGSDFDLGLAVTNYGTVIDKDKLADGLNFTSNGQRTTPHNGLTTLSTSMAQKTIREIAVAGMGAASAAQFSLPEYDIILTGNTIGTSAAVVSFVGYFAE